MPRSSRHKSSKHGTRDSREYSESEDDLGVTERKGGNEEDGGSVRVSKDSVFSEKKLASKESRRDAYDVGSGNGDCEEDYGNSSLRRRKGRGSDDGVSDRWNGGSESVDDRSEGSKKARGSWDSKSSNRQREDEVEDAKRGGGRSEKHSSRESSRKEGKERDRDRDKDRDRERDRYKEKDRERERDSEKNGKGGKGYKFGKNQDERSSSKREITTGKVTVLI